jgi:hypothetical protein
LYGEFLLGKVFILEMYQVFNYVKRTDLLMDNEKQGTPARTPLTIYPYMGWLCKPGAWGCFLTGRKEKAKRL